MSKRSVRQPAVVGQFYPADPDLLQRDVEEYISQASLPADLDRVRAVIAPHAGYVYSGATAGYAFKALKQLPERERTVFLLGPAHRVPVSGVALGNYASFRTPLGDAPVAVDRVNDMLDSAPFYTSAPAAHEPEHCLEVEVPFLQLSLADFKLVPMLFGQVNPREVAADLFDRLKEHDLIVVSSDLSHFHSYDQARQRDQAFLDALLEGSVKGVREGEACGRAPVMTLMEIAERKGWVPHLLDYRNSGDTAGSRSRVVGYGAIAYTS